ncbi:WD domain, G-beta repeat domain containing protein, putative [Eimeria praecox]|uniref:WD domain, G-beta repeat domain containing protein, putative n=1 Tax=Eimeria praecox TaxID=51316 RepID=U6H6S8_9EIME|nr:WD domain, G-beta repeat domain containing protein, putative [Eimeria praecox]
MKVELPVGPFDSEQTNEYKERGDYEGFHFGLSSYKFKIVKRLPHPRESNCARYMPQRPSIIASCAVDGRVLLYDLDAPGICEGPQASLTGNKGEATCLSWNPHREGQIVSCSSEGSWVLHNVAATSLAGQRFEVCRQLGYSPAYNAADWGERVGEILDPEDAEDGPPELLFTHGGHLADIYDASWNCEDKFPQMVASVANDNKLHIWQPKSSVFFESDSEEEEDPEQLEFKVSESSSTVPYIQLVLLRASDSLQQQQQQQQQKQQQQQHQKRQQQQQQEQQQQQQQQQQKQQASPLKPLLRAAVQEI